MSENQDAMHTLKENVSSTSIWMRIVYMVLFYIAGHIAIALILLIAVAQALLTLVTGSANQNLLEFSTGLNRYLHQMASFMTFNSEEKPFPFTDWPGQDNH
ncbi:DUF4389 domain-containing protein [Parendozoicomonas haliclonae]|uniref:Lipase n=1 Tax=Parendozoicomonas haliclonae TaxID=1960125 RepID=A0A1X7AKH4_9GAMM|nr:DUF4389 domain-containing protein [Parendozoicomonas haliclonae]SMA47397.1 hypothetical protein EHSB41UT_02403 [Parendozoicomonas haliclonae]